MKLAIVKYNAGNVCSVTNALERLGIQPIVTDNAEELRSADKVIFPGVGEANTAMNYLRARGLDKVITGFRQPVLGICLGLQLMCRHSEENDTACLGIFDIEVKKFIEPTPGSFKIPQMGWNNLENLKGKLFENLPAEPYVYFVHSYYAALSEFTIAECTYANTFSAGLHRDNFYALQFHPEKSGETGAKILSNFLEL